MEKNNFLTIGEVSKISGVHIKSLRYYDRIGVLTPAYVNPETSYRYYSFSQLGILDAIQTCVELDIPLKQFAEFSEDGGRNIHYSQLLDYGKQIAEKKIHSIREGLRLIEALQKEIKRAEEHRVLPQPITCEIPEKYYLVMPFEGGHSDEPFRNSLGWLMLEAKNRDYQIGYEFGLIHFYRNHSVERYLGIDILSKVRGKMKDVCTVPAGTFLSIHTETSKIETAPELFPKLFAEECGRVVIETELLTGDYDIMKPAYELRCSVTDVRQQ